MWGCVLRTALDIDFYGNTEEIRTAVLKGKGAQIETGVYVDSKDRI